MSKYQIPIKLEPAFQDYLWGGCRLRDSYCKPAPKEWAKVAEAWEVSTHPHGLSKITDGPFQGYTFAQYLEEAGPKVLGSRFAQAKLPILIKYIDAAKDLSLQVHPNDDYARKYEDSPGKTEMWYVIDAEPDAFIYFGFKKKITKKEFLARIQNETLPEVLRKVPAKKGDIFFIPSGTLHGIGKGLLIVEIQQCCDLTYRVYDYGRIDKDGKPRPLHIDKALDVTILEPANPEVIKPPIKLNSRAKITTLVTFKDFIVKKVKINGKLQLLSLVDTYQVLMAIESELDLFWQNQVYHLHKGETIFLPAGLGTYHLKGKGELLLVTDN